MSRLYFTPEIRELRGPVGREVLRPKVGALLELLIQGHPSLVTIETCLAELWPETHVEPRSLAQVVVELRKSIETVGGSRDWLENIPKSGYRLTVKPEIEQVVSSPDSEEKSPAKKGRPPALLWRGWVAHCGIAVLVMASIWLLRQKKSSMTPGEGPLRLAVLPIQGTLEAEMDWLKLAYPDSLSNALARTGLVEVVDFGDVYQILQNRAEGSQKAIPWQDSPVTKSLGANTLVRIQYLPGRSPPAFRLSLSSSAGETSFLFPSREAQATIEVVADRIFDALGLHHPVGEFLDNAYLNETYAQGYTHFLKGEYAQAEPYLKICFDQNPTFNRHAYHLATCFLHLRRFEALEALFRNPQCPQSAEWKYLQGELEFARRNFVEAEALLHPILEMEDLSRDIAARTNHLLGILLSRTDRFDQAQGFFDAANRHFEAANNLSGKVNSLLAQLRTWQTMGLPVERERWESLIGLAELLQNRSIQSRALIGLGDYFYFSQQWAGALSAYEKSLEIRRDLEDTAGVGVCLAGLGTSAMQLRRFEEAEAYLKEAMTINVQLGDTYNQVNQALNLGTLYIAMRRPSLAASMFESAKRISRAENDIQGEALAILGLAEVALHGNDHDKAASLLDEGLALGVRQSNIDAQYDSYGSVVAYKRGEADKALELMVRAKLKYGESGWNYRTQAYLEIYQATVKDGIYRALPYEKDPLLGPYP